MCDTSLEEDLDRYRRNNVELAVALNDLKSELNIVQMQLLDRNRELQRVFDENASLKQSLAQKESEMSSWRAVIVDMVTSNTRKYTEVMQKIGLVPAANVAPKPNAISVPKPENAVSESSSDQNERLNMLKRQKNVNNYSPPRLSDLTEESIQSSKLNESNGFTSTPEKNVTHVTARRRVSIPQTTSPPTPLRIIQERMLGNNELRGKKSSAKVQKMEKIIDENVPTNGATIGRPIRKTAPKNLSEPKLSTKLRRN